MLSSTIMLPCSWVCFFCPISGLRSHTSVSGASPVSWRVNTTVVVYVIRLSPDFLWQSEAAAMARLLLLFVGFYCCREEAIVIEEARAALPETDRWEPGLQMVRGSLGRQETTRGSKTQGLPQWLLSSLLSTPCLSAFLCSLSASSPVCELSCLLDMINGPGIRRPARFRFTLQSREESCTSLCLLLGRWRVSWSSLQGWAGTFITQICTWLSVLSCTNHKGWWLKSFHWHKISFNFALPFNTPFLRLSTGHLKETFSLGS